MSAWLDRLAAAVPGGAPAEPLALVSVLATEGSAPRGAGARMVVTARETVDTIGGGALEYRAVEQARALLAHPPGSWRVQDWPLGPLLGQCCGGRVRLLVEHLDPARCAWVGQPGAWLVSRLMVDHVARERVADAAPHRPGARGDRPDVGARFVEPLHGRRRPLYLFGAGHVGQAIARRAQGLPFALAWFDSRPETAALPGVTAADEAMLERCVAAAPATAALVVLTHSHALDYALTRAALRRPQTAYVGLIGSATKRARFRSRLERDGVSAAARARLVCPIGLPGIDGKEPDVIATALLAQLLLLDGGDTPAEEGMRMGQDSDGGDRPA